MKAARLARQHELRRRTALRRCNPRRIRRLRAKQFGPQAALCRTMPCCSCKAPPPSDPHHLKSRGAGGSDGDCVPLCRECHSVLHSYGRARFEVAARVDFGVVLQRMRALVLDENDLPVSLSLGVLK